MFHVRLGLLTKTSPIFMMVAALLLSLPIHAHSQPQDMSYFATPEEVAAANCAAVTSADGTANQLSNEARVQGTLQGNFVPIRGEFPNGLRYALPPSSLLSVSIDRGTDFHLAGGGNLFYGGKLVAWESSWLLCYHGGSVHFGWVDTSKPFLRIFPEEGSLSEDGIYQRFHTQHYWRSIDTNGSAIETLNDRWMLETCEGVLIEENCIPFDAKYLDISYAGLDDVLFLRMLPDLEYLNLGFNPLYDLSPLRQLAKLEELDLGEMRTDDRVLDISALANLRDLVILDISDNIIEDLSSLSALPQLERIIAFGTNVQDLAPLADVTTLRHLQLQDMPLEDISSLGGLHNLEALYLNGTGVSDLSALRTLTKLEILVLPNGNELRGQAEIQTAIAE